MTAAIGRIITGTAATGIAIATVIVMTTAVVPTGNTADLIETTVDLIEIKDGPDETTGGPIAPTIVVGPIAAAGVVTGTTTPAT